MTTQVVVNFEVVQIRQNDTEVLLLAFSAAEFLLQAVFEKASVIETGQWVGDGELLKLAGFLQDRGPIDHPYGMAGKSPYQVEVGFGKVAAIFFVCQVEDADQPIIGFERQADKGLGFEARPVFRGHTGVSLYIVDQHREATL